MFGEHYVKRRTQASYLSYVHIKNLTPYKFVAK